MKRCEIADRVNILNEEILFNGYGLYSEDIKERYYLEINLDSKKNENSLVSFMINPSNTLPETEDKKSKIDNTIKNLIKIAYKKYDKLIVLNIFPQICSNQIGLSENTTNNNFIEEFLNKNLNNTDLLIATGHDKDKNYFNKITEKINNYKDKFDKIFYLSVDTEKFKKFIEKEEINFILHPANRIINAYGGCENIMLKELKL